MENSNQLILLKKNKGTFIAKKGITSAVFIFIIIMALTGCSRAAYREEMKAGDSSAAEGKAEIEEDTPYAGKAEESISDHKDMEDSDDAEELEEQERKPADYIQEEGQTLQTRIKEPENYKRTETAADSFAAFIRNYPVKPDKSPVLLYDGREKGRQDVHAAVFAMHLERRDLQQCADSVMRLYAEYFYKQESYDKITFHFVSGFVFDFDTWRRGNKLLIDGNAVSWVSAGNDSSEDSFERYLLTLFAYASTLSMEQESEEIALQEIEAGDIFINGGSPGHVVMVADVCVNSEGEKAFLLAQGYMPAQEFHIIKNPLHEEDPWYYASEITYPLLTPEYSFKEGSLKRPSYLSGM